MHGAHLAWVQRRSAADLSGHPWLGCSPGLPVACVQESKRTSNTDRAIAQVLSYAGNVSAPARAPAAVAPAAHRGCSPLRRLSPARLARPTGGAAGSAAHLDVPCPCALQAADPVDVIPAPHMLNSAAQTQYASLHDLINQ